MCDLDVLSLLDHLHTVEREYYRLLFLHEEGRAGREALDRSLSEVRRLNAEFDEAVQSGRSGAVTLF